MADDRGQDINSNIQAPNNKQIPNHNNQ